MRYPYHCTFCGFAQEYEFPMTAEIPELITNHTHRKDPLGFCPTTCLHRVYTSPATNLGPQAHHDQAHPYASWQKHAKSLELRAP